MKEFMRKSMLIWGLLKPSLEDFSSKIADNNLGVKYFLGHSENEFFTLRAYCSFIYDSDGDEIAITFDVKHAGNKFTIEVDIIGSDNNIMGSQDFLVPEVDDDSEFEKIIETWLLELSRFLSDRFQIVNDAVAALR